MYICYKDNFFSCKTFLYMFMKTQTEKKKKYDFFYYSDIRNYSYIEVTIQDIR